VPVIVPPAEIANVFVCKVWDSPNVEDQVYCFPVEADTGDVKEYVREYESASHLEYGN
jgi:hypothetical protein